MNRCFIALAKRRAGGLPLGNLLIVAALLLVATGSGCSRLRLPAIDSTGRCLFAPKGTTTTFALPGCNGEATICNRAMDHLKLRLQEHKAKLRAHKDKLKGVFPPKSAFPEPATPPKCQVPSLPGALGKGKKPEACVPSAPCGLGCECGPPAVLYGCEIDLKPNKLPRSGKRGCILLTPQKIVAPVGGEVILLSGICGNDGYLQTNQRLEWMLTQDSVGTFIQVGDDAPSLLGRLAAAKKQPTKHDPSYAHGLTSSKRIKITRGNNDPRDDVQLEKGQTWISLSSPNEGTSRVTVLAPDSNCWDQRKATATIYWIDARWQFPGPQLVPAGTPVQLSTRVTKAEGTIPAEGWRVRYEIQQPELALFAGPTPSSVVEAVVDGSGNATVQLLPNAGTAGTATIDMTVIRPTGQADQMPTMTIGRGQTFVTWSSPKLALRAGAPPVATFDVPVQVVANVSNPGDQPATNVRVEASIPPGVRVTEADSFATVTDRTVIWEIGTLPPQQQLDLFMNVAAQQSGAINFVAIGDNLRADDSVRIDVFQPSLQLKVAPESDRYEAGQPVTFNIDLTNSGNRALNNVELTATGDDAMEHSQGGRGIRNRRETPLQPGETWRKSVTFLPTASGQRCITVQGFADGGQQIQEQSCVTVLNAPPPNREISAVLQGPDRFTVGGPADVVTATITNTGEVTLQDIKVAMVSDPQLQFSQATADYRDRAGRNIAEWTIPSLGPSQVVHLQGEFIGSAVGANSRVRVTAVSGDGVSDETDFVTNVVPPLPSGGSPVAPPLPPASPAPEIPGGAAPSQPAPLTGPPGGGGPIQPQRSGRLRAELFGRNNPVRVNDQIGYSLRILNDSNERDGQVLIDFQLPAGVSVVGANPVKNPKQGEYDRNAGVISLPLIRTLEPGEAIDYEIVLSSNIPQQVNLNVRVRSLREPNGVIVGATTDVR